MLGCLARGGGHLLCALLRRKLLRLAVAGCLLGKHRRKLCVVGLIDLARQGEALRYLQCAR